MKISIILLLIVSHISLAYISYCNGYETSTRDFIEKQENFGEYIEKDINELLKKVENTKIETNPELDKIINSN